MLTLTKITMVTIAPVKRPTAINTTIKIKRFLKDFDVVRMKTVEHCFTPDNTRCLATVK